MCYKVAYDLVVRLVEEEGASRQEVFLVHGSIVPKAGPDAGTRIDHAWVVTSDRVYDYSAEPSILCSADVYRGFDPMVSRQYTYEEATWQLCASEHYGPWQESDFIREEFR